MSFPIYVDVVYLWSLTAFNFITQIYTLLLKYQTFFAVFFKSILRKHLFLQIPNFLFKNTTLFLQIQIFFYFATIKYHCKAKNMFYRFITAICFALITFVGQAKSVSGVVIDEHTKEALPACMSLW